MFYGVYCVYASRKHLITESNVFFLNLSRLLFFEPVSTKDNSLLRCQFFIDGKRLKFDLFVHTLVAYSSVHFYPFLDVGDPWEAGLEILLCMCVDSPVIWSHLI